MKRVELTRGLFALVDDEDHERVSTRSWCAVRRTRKWYAVGTLNGSKVYLHRFLMNAKKGQEIDHINHDGLDNRRANLRFCERRDNNANQRAIRPRAGRFKGISPVVHGRWRAQIKVTRNKVKHLGVFDTQAAAARAYDAAARLVFGEFACCNFGGRS